MSYLTCTNVFQEMKCYPHFPNSLWKKTLCDTSGCLSSNSIIWKWQSRLPSKLFSAAHNFLVSPPNHPFLLKNFILCMLVSLHFSFIEIASFRSKSCLKMVSLQLRLFNKTVWSSETKKCSSFPSDCLVAKDTIKVGRWMGNVLSSLNQGYVFPLFPFNQRAELSLMHSFYIYCTSVCPEPCWAESTWEGRHVHT